MGSVIEWPPGSGRRSTWSDDERALALELAGREDVPRAARARELETLHDLKVEFGVDLVADERPRYRMGQGSGATAR